jgi:hypothetical protein
VKAYKQFLSEGFRFDWSKDPRSPDSQVVHINHHGGELHGSSLCGAAKPEKESLPSLSAPNCSSCKKVHDSMKSDKGFFNESIDIEPSHKGLLHKHLGVPEGQEIPEDKLREAAHGEDLHIRKMAQFALEARKWHHHKLRSRPRFG